MSWLIGILTVILVLDCLLLILLVLVQLPKKEAGMGQAFGGGATDALFGAGSGNALTKMTKYTTAVFFILTLSLSVLNAQQSKARRSQFGREIEKAGKGDAAPRPVAPLTGTTTTTSQASSTPGTNLGMLSGATNKPAAALTNRAPSIPATTNQPK